MVELSVDKNNEELTQMFPLSLLVLIGAMYVFVRHQILLAFARTKMGSALNNFRFGFKTGELNYEERRKPKRDLAEERKVKSKRRL